MTWLLHKCKDPSWTAKSSAVTLPFLLFRPTSMKPFRCFCMSMYFGLAGQDDVIGKVLSGAVYSCSRSVRNIGCLFDSKPAFFAHSYTNRYSQKSTASFINSESSSSISGKVCEIAISSPKFASNAGSIGTSFVLFVDDAAPNA
jgi:hypothetical protein